IVYQEVCHVKRQLLEITNFIQAQQLEFQQKSRAPVVAVPNGTFKLYIFHSTRGYDATCLGPLTIRHHPTRKSTDFIETIPPIKLAQSPILKDIKPPIFAELIKNNIENDEGAKLALNKFAKNLMENQHKENKDSSSYIFSFIINNHNLKDFINNIRNTQELIMHHSNLIL
ncbi:37683_t:CDS:2, partial [Gigaspora margarita]